MLGFTVPVAASHGLEAVESLQAQASARPITVALMVGRSRIGDPHFGSWRMKSAVDQPAAPARTCFFMVGRPAPLQRRSAGSSPSELLHGHETRVPAALHTARARGNRDN